MDQGEMMRNRWQYQGALHTQDGKLHGSGSISFHEEPALKHLRKRMALFLITHFGRKPGLNLTIECVYSPPGKKR